jgi:hypothetical protein
MREVVEADVTVDTEGHTEGAKRRDGQSRRSCSGGSAGVVEPGHAWRGSPRNLGGPVRSVHETEPRIASASEQERGGGTSERAVVATKQGNRSEGTLWSEGRAGTWNRERERWKRHRARYPSQRDLNG